MRKHLYYEIYFTNASVSQANIFGIDKISE